MPSQERIEEVARIANCHDFITRFPGKEAGGWGGPSSHKYLLVTLEPRSGGDMVIMMVMWCGHPECRGIRDGGGGARHTSQWWPEAAHLYCSGFVSQPSYPPIG